MAKKHAVGGDSPTNGAKEFIESGIPYTAVVRIQGCADYLYHRWNNESVKEKAEAARGSRIRKQDDLESYVYRNKEGYLCIPGEQLRMGIIACARFKTDPRSVRKSAMDLYKAGVVSLTPLAVAGGKDWDYIDRRRVVIQRNAITRERPALKEGWTAEFVLQVNLPEYIHPSDLHETISMMGRVNGIGDFRPSYGRFQVTKFEVNKDKRAA
jgi:hypothetical protein